jgi:hypothetical protein
MYNRLFHMERLQNLESDEFPSGRFSGLFPGTNPLDPAHGMADLGA